MTESNNIFDELPFPRDVTMMIFRILHKSIVTELNVEYHKKIEGIISIYDVYGLKTYLGTSKRNNNVFVFNYRSKVYLRYRDGPCHIYNIRDSTSVLLPYNY